MPRGVVGVAMDDVRINVSMDGVVRTVKTVRRGMTYAEFKKQLRDCLRDCPPGELSVLLKMGHEKFTKFEFADGYDVSQELVKNDTVQVVVSDGGGRADGGAAGVDGGAAGVDGGAEDGDAARGQKRPAEELEDKKPHLPHARGRPKRAVTQGPFKVGETVSVLISHQVDCPPKSTLATIKEVNKGRDGNEYAINFLYPAQIFESHREAPDGGRFTEQHMTKKDWKAVQSNTTGWPGSKLTKIQDGGWVRDGEADSE